MPPTAEILAIGTEILLGEIPDTNTQAIARALRQIGLDLYRTGAVGDNAERIAQAVKEARQRAQVLITTGGLGPTVDDATREGIAAAMGVELEFRPELWEQIKSRFARFGYEPPENNRRQAMLPAGAQAIENPVGTAPGFMVEREQQLVISLPGVPAELIHLLQTEVIPFLRQRFKLSGVIKTRLIRTAGVGESWLDERIGDLEQLSNPTVGLSAHPGQVDIRITAKAASEMEAEQMIWGLQATLQQRLKGRIFGIDEDTLEGSVLKAIQASGWRLAVVESGTNGRLAASLAEGGSPAFAGGQLLADPPGLGDIPALLENALSANGAEVALLLSLQREGAKHVLSMAMRSPSGEDQVERSYGGAPANAPRWAVSLALDRLRRHLAAS